MSIRELLVTGFSLVIIISYLLGERIWLTKRVRSIPLRICVTGTRGKSSVARLIGASLREAGFRVLTKTTGSKPVLIYPDGAEREIVRRGSPSILEEKSILKSGAKLRVEALVIELMSITPECGYIESRRLVEPHILVITNVRIDHTEQMGSTKEDIASCFSSYIPPQSTVFIPKREFWPVFQEKADQRQAHLSQVTEGLSRRCQAGASTFPFFEFEENVGLSLAVVDFLGIGKKIALKGMAKTKPDFGSLKLWTVDFVSPPHRWYLVNSFAANDPESTRIILSRLSQKKLFEGKKIVGLLNLRRDRGDRTVQWLAALKGGEFSELATLFIMGDHAPALKRKLRLLPSTAMHVIHSRSPEKIMEKISAIEKGEIILLGMGNIGGRGGELVNYWERRGKSYDV